MNTINYKEIQSLLNTFTSLRSKSSENNTKAISSLKSFFQSGINYGGLAESSNTLINKVNTSAQTLDKDYERIINFLTKVASEAESTHNKQITQMSATNIWNVQESTRG